MAESIKPVLCVVTSNPIKGDTGIATGFWLSELTHPLAVLQDAGIPTELVSVRGAHPPVDGFDLSRLGRAFGAAVGDPRYAAAADLDRDGQIDGADLALLAAQFGK